MPPIAKIFKLFSEVLSTTTTGFARVAVHSFRTQTQLKAIVESPALKSRRFRVSRMYFTASWITLAPKYTIKLLSTRIRPKTTLLHSV